MFFRGWCICYEGGGGMGGYNYVRGWLNTLKFARNEHIKIYDGKMLWSSLFCWKKRCSSVGDAFVLSIRRQLDKNRCLYRWCSAKCYPGLCSKRGLRHFACNHKKTAYWVLTQEQLTTYGRCWKKPGPILYQHVVPRSSPSLLNWIRSCGLTSVLGSCIGKMQSMLLLRRLLPRLCGTCEKKGAHLPSAFANM